MLISTDHSDVDYEMVCKNAALVIDTRNATKGIKKSKAVIVKA
ncbi:MAG: hypothetical protein ACKVS9_10970 [Phycisphaerae bacterium]